MTYGSICSGIEAATVAWHPLGWKPAFFAEIDKFPSAVLAHHYPEVPNLGDFTKIQPGDAGPIDILVGGTPCQSFSVAGKRLGLDDPRGNLTLEWLRLVQRLLPRWLVWENVPGVLSNDGGRTFGTIFATLGELGYRYAWRVLDAQYFHLAQQRERVFLVASLGAGHPGAVLFEPESVSRHTTPSKEAGAQVAALTANGVGTCGADDNQAQAGHLIAHCLRGEGFDASEDGTGRGTPLVAHCLNARGGTGRIDVESETFIVNARQDPVIYGRCTGAIDTDGSTYGVSTEVGVRRITPLEAERLQGFPDHYTLVPYRSKPAADGPRYKAIGNSMAVPCMRWIGERIAFVDGLEVAA